MITTSLHILSTPSKERFSTVLRRIEAVAQWCSIKKMFLEVSQNSQENTCIRVSF